MYITRKEAVRECKELWKEIEESGLTKYEFLNSFDGAKWKAKHYQSNCPLCEYAHYFSSGCLQCPLITQYSKRCDELDFGNNMHSKPKWFGYIRGLKERLGARR